MPNSPGPHRVPLLPGEDFNDLPIPAARLPVRSWFRVHWNQTPALEFSLKAHHRFSHPDSPHKVLYLAPTIQTCLWEVFGDSVFQTGRVIASSRWDSCCVTKVTIPELKVCAVSLEKTRSVMRVDKSSLTSTDLTIPQAWSLALQNHPKGFDGIKYTSRFIDQPCLALFDRKGVRKRLKTTRLGSLNDQDAAVDWLHAQNAALV